MPQLAGYRRPSPGTQPSYLHAPYVSSLKRAPLQPFVPIPQTLTEITGPQFGGEFVDAKACDLTRQHSGDPLGERIIVSGRVLDEHARPVAGTLVEIWQANAAGRYLHKVDQHNAPLDPNFTGCGHVLSDAEGRYRFVTIRPGAYPWENHPNAWRPAHIHFSLFGPAFATRLVTQMYFPGDPLLPYDPIFNCTADEQARNRLISVFDWKTTIPVHALGYCWDITLAGREATPWEESRSSEGNDVSLQATTSQTVGPYFSIGLNRLKRTDLAGPGVFGEQVTITGQVLDGNRNPVPDALLEIWQANSHGKYAHPADEQNKPLEPGFDGFGRILVDESGRFSFTTIKPGAVPGPNGKLQGPHLAVSVFMRGLLRRLVTRIYFPDETANAADSILNLVEPERCTTLIAKKSLGQAGVLEWNVILQGPGETVFFDCGL